MTLPSAKSLWVVVLAEFWLAGGAWAQVDYRVNQGDRLGTGHALDNNLGLGTGGLNTPITRFDYGYGANSIVTGNVTGLGGFQGFAPITGTNTFRGSLPSASLSTFYGQSVGLSGVQPYQVQVPSYYFDRQQTIADLGYIRGGLNAPGSSTLASPYSGPFVPEAPQAGAVLPSVIAPTIGLAPTAPTAFGVFQRPVNPNAPLSPTPTVFQNAAQSSIFGVPLPGPSSARTGAVEAARTGPPRSWNDQTDIWSLEGQRRVEQAGGGEMPPGPQETPETGPDRPTSLLTRPVTGSRLTPESFGTRQVGGPRTSSTPPEALAGAGPSVGPGTAEGPSQEFGTRLVRPGERPEATGGTTLAVAGTAQQPGQPTAASGALGQNRFSDLYRAVETAQKLGIRNLGFQPPGQAETSPPAESATEAGPGQPAPQRPSFETLHRSSDAAVASLAASARWAKDLLEEPITTFAGANVGRFGNYMTTAERALKSGDYYRAAGLYDLAHLIAPDDPLPLLGRGNALVAAGDYRSAALAIQQGIQRFPQIAAFRLDLIALVGQPDIFDRRRADLEDNLARSEQYELRFLLGYLELYSSLPDEGLRDLEQAAKEAPQDSVVAIFPDLLLGRRVLPELNKK